MLNSVSFGSNAGVFTKPDFAKPQTFTKPVAPEAPVEAPKKKGKAGKVILGLALTAAAVAGALFAGNKTGFFKNIGKYIPESIKNANWLQKAKEPAKQAFAALDKAGAWIGEKGGAVVNTVKGWFAKAPETPAV